MTKEDYSKMSKKDLIEKILVLNTLNHSLRNVVQAKQLQLDAIEKHREFFYREWPR